MGALRERAEQARAAVEAQSADLAASLPSQSNGRVAGPPAGIVEEPPPYSAPPPVAYAGHALIPDAPLMPRDDAPLQSFAGIDDDGIPPWQD